MAMEIVGQNSECTCWENEKGDWLCASRANTRKGVYWSVSVGNHDLDGFLVLGTRCTWEQVLRFVATKNANS